MENFAPNAPYIAAYRLSDDRRKQQQQDFPRESLQIRNLIENLAPTEPKNFHKREKVHGIFIINFKFLPERSQRNIKDLILYSSIFKRTKFSVISHLSGLES